jgi:methionyl-tRNA formyltransferase
VAFKEVQPSGKKRLSVADWARGRDDLPGLVLE